MVQQKISQDFAFYGSPFHGMIRSSRGNPSQSDTVILCRGKENFYGYNEFEDMARVDEYLDEAYEALKRLSADDEKRLEYEARAKVLRDHINMPEGIKEEGMEAGRKEGIQMAVRAVALHVQGMTDDEIACQ